MARFFFRLRGLQETCDAQGSEAEHEASVPWPDHLLIRSISRSLPEREIALGFSEAVVRATRIKSPTRLERPIGKKNALFSL